MTLSRLAAAPAAEMRYPPSLAANSIPCRCSSARRPACLSAPTGACTFGLVLHEQVPPDVYLEGAITRQSSLSQEHQGPRAVLNALERLASGYGPECDRIRQDLAIAESQLRDYQARLGAPFLHDGYLSELTTLRDQLKAGLSGKTPEPGSEPPPSVSELAARIKALKAAHSIEATPQRIRQKQSSAEEPVTARIRRRTEAHAVSDPAIQPDRIRAGSIRAGRIHMARPLPTTRRLPRFRPTYASTFRPGAIKPQMTFQQRLAMERQRKDLEPSLS